MPTWTPFQKRCSLVLKEMGEQINISSAWLCQHDFERAVSTVQGQYVSDEASVLEGIWDLNTEYAEFDFPNTVAWLKGETHPPRILHVDELDYADPERKEYIEAGNFTAMLLPVYVAGKIWGYIELWDSRDKRYFTDAEIATALAATEKLSTVIQL